MRFTFGIDMMVIAPELMLESAFSELTRTGSIENSADALKRQF